MKFSIEQLGSVKQATLSLSDLTIISGKNNTGKTYVTYALFGFLDSFHRGILNADMSRLFSEDDIAQLAEQGSLSIDLAPALKHTQSLLEQLNHDYIEKLDQVFNAPEGHFKDTKFAVSFDEIDAENANTASYSGKVSLGTEGKTKGTAEKSANSYMLDISFQHENGKSNKVPRPLLFNIVSDFALFALLNAHLPKVKVLTAERTGINIFQRELDFSRNSLVEQLMALRDREKNFNPLEFLLESTARYSHPIKSNVENVRALHASTKRNSMFFKDHPEAVKDIEKVLGVTYKVVDEEMQVVVSSKGKQKKTIELHLASTSARSLLELYTYLRYQAEKGDLLIVDEPELNLHPEAQVQLARVFAKMVNYGIKVLVTTHSDYIVKELNNLIVLAHDFEGKEAFMKEFGYKTNDVLSPTQVAAYVMEGGKSHAIPVDAYGLEKTSFDKAIDDLNYVAEEMAFRIEKGKMKVS